MRNPERGISRMAVHEEIRSEKSSGWRLAKKDEGEKAQDGGLRRDPEAREAKKRLSKKDDRPGNQKSRHPSKTAAREAKNAAIQGKKPPGSRKRGRDGKNGAGKAQKVAGRPQSRAGPSARDASRLFYSRD
jgi:hypothetical protein